MAAKKTSKKSPKTETEVTETKPNGEAVEKDEKVLKIGRDVAAKLLRTMGFKETQKYSNEILTRRLNKMKEYVANYDGTLDGDTQDLVDAVIAAKDHIKVTGDEPKGTKKDPAEKKTDGGKKPATSKTPKEKKPRQPRAGGPSNKEQVWKMYEKVSNKDKAGEKADEWFEKVNKQVKVTTIRGWISAWNRGQNLPGCAKKA